MGEIAHDDGKAKKGGKPKGKKMSTHIDMTPMVDLAFLLLTFFMLATSFNKPKAMEIAMPADEKTPPIDIPELDKNDAFTVLIGPDDKLLYYIGMPDKPQLESSNYGPDGIRKVLMKRRAERDAQKSDNQFMVIIKADDKARYEHIVDIFDEMNITKMKRYALIDISAKEKEMLNQK